MISFEPDELQQILDTFAESDSYQQVADKFNLGWDTAKRRVLKAIKEGYRPSPGIKHKLDIPMSEDESRFKKEWTEEDCKGELRRIAKMNEGKVISRNFFREHSRCSEATWNRYFGTFEEFKRAAGLQLTRAQHLLEKQIAKHASADKLEQYNLERINYAGKFLKPTGRLTERHITLSDIHDVSCDPFYRRVVLATIARIQPDVLVLDGDIFDLPEFGKYHVDPRTWDPTGRIKWVHEFLKECREAAPDMQIDFIEGNHEYRLIRHLSEASPALQTVLGDLVGLTIPKIFGLDAFEVNYIANGDLKAFNVSDIKQEVRKNYKVYHHQWLVSHFPEHKNYALPGINGHHHKLKATPEFNEIFGSYCWWQNPAGHMQIAEYCDARKWQVGFTIQLLDLQSKNTLVTPVDLTHDLAEVGGEVYVRDESEKFIGE